jgi:hypothetical protein
MTHRAVPNPTPYIAAVLAVGIVRARMAEHSRREALADTYGLSLKELAQAQSIAQRHHYTVGQAAEIVRRSRRL